MTNNLCAANVFFLILAMALVIQVAYNTIKPWLHCAGCSGACDYRCSETHHKKPCLLYCNQCCQKCLCVPSGTYGNKQECPCYNDWKTQEGTPKCP
ncbi:unnamed protein product [Lupinus luteus]|uniref:Gibberellin regulated protein n=1 Tax=Lupinus luteus TaxID=3873 RepID=A0AAV1WAX0_LUPLU